MTLATSGVSPPPPPALLDDRSSSLPGLLEDARLSRLGDPEAAWSLAVAPQTAAWAHGAAERPCGLGLNLPPAEQRALGRQFGRLPGRWALGEESTFGRVACAAVRDTAALARWVAPLAAEGLLALERSSRRSALDAAPEVARVTFRRAFEVRRGESKPADPVANVFIDAVTRPQGNPRAQLVSGLWALAGDVWFDELWSISGVGAFDWAMPPPSTLRERHEIVRRWYERFA